MTNPSFNLTFMLQISNKEDSAPRIQSFKIANNRIIPTSNTLKNFRIMTDCLNYLAGIFT